MSAVLGWIASVFAKVPLWVWLVIGLCLWLVFQHLDITHLRAEVVAAQQASDAAIKANASDLQTIKTLQSANVAWQQRCEADAAKATDEKAELQQQVTQISLDNVNLQDALNKTYATKDDQQWANEATPPDIEQQLRKTFAGKGH